MVLIYLLKLDLILAMIANYPYQKHHFFVTCLVQILFDNFLNNILLFMILIIVNHYSMPIMSMPCFHILLHIHIIQLIGMKFSFYDLSKLFIYFFFCRLTSYLPQSRNSLRVRDIETRCRLLKNGRLQVVSFLTELPETQHDPQSFAVDLTLFTVSTSHPRRQLIMYIFP